MDLFISEHVTRLARGVGASRAGWRRMSPDYLINAPGFDRPLLHGLNLALPVALHRSKSIPTGSPIFYATLVITVQHNASYGNVTQLTLRTLLVVWKKKIASGQ